MKNIAEILKLSSDYLKEKGVESPRLQVEELLAHILKMKRLDLYLQFDRPLVEEELHFLREWLKRRAQGEPLEYILGEVEFYNCRIKINSSVLIPRPETEILVHKILEQNAQESLEVWDICCGSGCVGIALKKARPHWNITLSDISKEALLVAQENARLNDVSLHFLEGDLLTPFEGKKANLVICNPPYVTEEQYLTLGREVRLFEPKIALVAGRTGFEFYEKLALHLPTFLKENAKLYLEIGTGMGEGVKKIFSTEKWRDLRVEEDWSGHTRYFFLKNGFT